MNAMTNDFACIEAATYATGDSPLNGRSHDGCASLGRLQWFVCRSQPQLEKLAAQDLARRGFTAWCPMVSVRRPVLPRALLSRKMRRESPTTAIVIEPLFRGYLFVQANLATDDWSQILSADGIKDMLRSVGGRPMPVRGLEIDRARKTQEAEFIPAKLIPDIEVGSALILQNGPFMDHQGICLWSSEKRVRVLLSLFGKNREVSVSRSDVAALGGV